MNPLVGAGVLQGRARPRDLSDCPLDGFGGHVGIEAFDCGAETSDQEDLRLVVAAERPVRTERLVVRLDVIPVELPEQLDGWLLDKLVFAVLARWRKCHAATSGMATSSFGRIDVARDEVREEQGPRDFGIVGGSSQVLYQISQGTDGTSETDLESAIWPEDLKVA